MRRKGILLVVLLVVAALLYLAFSQKDVQVVRQITVEAGDIQPTIRVTGHVINDKTVTMTALLNGQIEGMLVQKGDHVEAGQVLAYLDKREAEAQLAKAVAVLAREKQAVDEARARLKRLQGVKASGGATEQMIEDAEAQLNAAEARLRVADAELRVARIHHEKTELRAPFAGVITEKTSEQGQWVEAGTKLLTLVGDAGREIEVNVDAGDSGTVRIGQTVRLTCDAFPGLIWEEQIHWIAPSIIQDEQNEAVNTFAARISLGEQAPPLLLGQQVDAQIVLAEKKAVPRLPYSALRSDGDVYRAAVLRDGRVHYVSIHTGLEDDTHIEILDGLKPGDMVLLSEGKPLHAGQAVQVKP